MPGPLTQRAIEAYSLPLPKTWADTVGTEGYWERVEAEARAQRQLEACELDEEPEEDELGQDWLPGYDITDDQ